MRVEEMGVDDYSTLDEELENTDVIYVGTTFQSINQGIFYYISPCLNNKHFSPGTKSQQSY